MSEFKVIETQEELDRVIQERLNRQKENLEKQYSDYDQLKTQVGDLQSAIDKTSESNKTYDDKIADLTSKLNGQEKSNLIMKTALEKGIPYDYMDLITGDDEASINEKADRISQLIPSKQQTPPPLKNTEPPLGEGKDGAYQSLIKGLDLEGE